MSYVFDSFLIKFGSFIISIYFLASDSLIYPSFETVKFK